MTTAEINPLTLPSLPLTRRAALPEIACVYFVISEEEVIYVGRTRNLRQRWASHEHRHCGEDYPAPKVAWLIPGDGATISKLERQLQIQFKPTLNNSREQQESYAPLCTRVPPEVRAFFEERAERQQRKLADVVRMALEDYVAAEIKAAAFRETIRI